MMVKMRAFVQKTEPENDFFCKKKMTETYVNEKKLIV